MSGDNAKTFEVLVDDPDEDPVRVEFWVARGTEVYEPIKVGPVQSGSTATASMQLELAGEYSVSALLSDGTGTTAVGSVSFTVDEDLPMPDPEFDPDERIVDVSPPPVDFDILDDQQVQIDAPLPDGFSLGRVVHNGEAVEVLDGEGEYVGVIYLFAILEDGTQHPVSVEDPSSDPSARSAAADGAFNVSLLCWVNNTCDEELGAVLAEGLRNAVVIGTFVAEASISASLLLTGQAVVTVGALKEQFLSFGRLPLPLGPVVVPGRLAMADAPDYRAGVGPDEQVLVPGRYMYKPDAGTLNDYCSYVESWYYDTQFFGPCARHDLCIEEMDESWPVPVRQEFRAMCDREFRNDLLHNCRVVNWEVERRQLLVGCTIVSFAMVGAVSLKTGVLP
ncbi:hypothetical protein D9V41_12520 [Aeromicrobium phragmitis]|uniref:Uncharacterized protein n=1 Tax=Aeromicrobium phragmitis TaxID=2478914 RepID=A0A3L8PIS4_9ACTN|nr:hypothetical protein D9V41_12520 [Aeromicrobium phragmitis]